jgi:hypothetical protein
MAVSVAGTMAAYEYGWLEEESSLYVLQMFGSFGVIFNMAQFWYVLECRPVPAVKCRKELMNMVADDSKQALPLDELCWNAGPSPMSNAGKNCDWKLPLNET